MLAKRASLFSRSTLTSRTAILAAALVSYACSSSEDPNSEGDGDGSGGAGELPSSGGSTASGGAIAAGTGGSIGSGGALTGTGGAPASGGAQGSGGGDVIGTGGGNSSTGGVDAGTGGAIGTGGESSGECVVGQTQGNQVVMIGESFIAATHDITSRIEELARENGSLAQGDSYIDNSVSGSMLVGNNQIPSQYQSAAQSNDIKYVLMDGGGNDCWINDDDTGALAAAEDLFAEMAQDGVEKVVYFFYPDPIGGQYASLTACLDRLRPEMQALCEGLESPKCYWLDQREIWDGHGEYTNDGIHPTQAGSYASAEGIWEVMQENCVAQ